MDGKLETISKYYPTVFLKCLRKTMRSSVRIAGVLAEM
jgi:hypothetical protein